MRFPGHPFPIAVSTRGTVVAFVFCVRISAMRHVFLVVNAARKKGNVSVYRFRSTRSVRSSSLVMRVRKVFDQSIVCVCVCIAKLFQRITCTCVINVSQRASVTKSCKSVERFCFSSFLFIFSFFLFYAIVSSTSSKEEYIERQYTSKSLIPSRLTLGFTESTIISQKSVIIVR